MAHQLVINSFTTQTLTEIITTPVIANLQVTDNSYTVTGNANVSTAGGYVRINGSNFAANSQVLIDRTPATAISFVSSLQLNVQVPAKSAGSYRVFVVNGDGAFGLRVNGISFS
jgi:hypothetical protein